MNDIHKISYTGAHYPSHGVRNVQADCGVLIEDVEILKLPLTSNPGIKEDQGVCTACLKIDPRRRMRHRIYVRERLKEDG